jgi:hypothetical protein
MAGQVTCACGKRYPWKPDLAGKRAKCKCGQAVSFPPIDPAELAEAEAFDDAVRQIEPHGRTPSGAPLYRHEARTKPFEPVTGDGESIDRISAHIEQHVGPVAGVFHEIVSDLVHVDVHLVAPTADRPWHTLVTSGMSDRPMTVPDGVDPAEQAFAELTICLPPDWPMEHAAWSDERNYWPIRWLKTLARLPHEYDTWLGWGHTVPNGDPPEPYAHGTKFCCMLLLPSISAGDDFHRLKVNDEKTINFYALYPLYKEEVDFKLKRGTEALIEKFFKAGVTDVVDVARRNACRKRFGLF